MSLSRLWKKNKAEVIALITGRMPQYIYGRRQFTDVPVFCFHSAYYPQFEKQLAFLSNHGFRTLDADQLLERVLDKHYRNDGKEIALTFDDGLASVWTIAYPLLERYQQKIISFILPGMIPEESFQTKTIGDDVTEEEKNALINRDFSDQPLCSWDEIQKMHSSGLVDFQSHGLHHRLVATSNQIVDFIHPDFDLHNYGNVHVPSYIQGQGFSREPVLGHPVYQHAPLLSQSSACLDNSDVRNACAKFVTEHGGPAFFKTQGWRKQLLAVVDQHTNSSNNRDQIDLAVDISAEFVQSKSMIETRLNKSVKHFCFPWFSCNEANVIAAKKAGYESVYLAATPGFTISDKAALPTLITRLQEEFLMALPGYRSLFAAISYKLTRKANW